MGFFYDLNHTIIMLDDSNETVDHLVNNAGIAPVCMFEDYTDVTNHASVMVITLLLFRYQL